MTLVWILLGGVGGSLIVLIVGYVWQRATDPAEVTENDVIMAVKMGERITAMRWYRRLHGVGVKEAKAAIGRLEREHRKTYGDTQTEDAKS